MARHGHTLVRALLLCASLVVACAPGAPPAAPTASTTAPAQPSAPTPSGVPAGTALLSPLPGSAPSASASSPLAVPAPSAAPNQALVPLAASYSEVIGTNLPVWIAQEGGYFRRSGLDVNLQSITSTTTIPALLSGQTQIALVGGSGVLSAVSQGADLVVLGTLLGVYPYVFEASADIQTPADLKGKRVGVR